MTLLKHLYQYTNSEVTDTMTKYVQFKIDGDYITETAQELLKQGELQKAITIVKGCTQSDQMSEQEHQNLIYDILNGRAIITGTYPNPDYQIKYPEDKQNANNIADYMLQLAKKAKSETEAKENLLERLSFIFEFLENHCSHILGQLCDEYQESFEEKLFAEINDYEFDIPRNKMCSDMLTSYIERAKMDTTDDYGWLEPNGTYHPVEWGLHNNWAENYIRKHYTENEMDRLYYNEEHMRIPATDVMIYKLHWILLHNPAQGLATHTSKPGQPLTKAAKQFLYDYYIKRKQIDKAKQVYESE